MSMPPEPPPAFSFQSAPTPQHARQLLGKRLRAARLAAHLTQAALAGTAYSKAYVSAVERGTMTPSLPALRFLAERLGVTLSYFLEEDLSALPVEVPAVPPEDTEQVARLHEAERLVQEGRYEAAIALFEQIGQRDRTSEAYEQYALLLAAQGRYQDAYEQMQRALHSRR